MIYQEEETEDEGLKPYLIAIIVLLLCILAAIAAALVAIVVWRLNVKPKTKTHSEYDIGL